MKQFRDRGGGLLEVMIALAVLLIGLVGVLTALNQAGKESRLGQNRQQKLLLADAALQRLRLADKAALFAAAPTISAHPTTFAIGAAPWARDTAVSTDAWDFSGGSYFDIFPDGTITLIDPAVDARFGGATPSCDAVPLGVVCREVLVHRGVPPCAAPCTTPIPVPTGVTALTAWVRLSRRIATTQPAELEIVLSQVMMQ